MTAIALNESQLFQSRTLTMLGKVRVRQTRTDAVQLLCGSVPYQTATQLAKFTFQGDPDSIQGPNSPSTKSSRLDFYYPADGYVFDFAPGDANNPANWLGLQDCFLSEAFTSAVFVSFTAYDYVTDALVFAQIMVENYAGQGSVLVPEPDVRVFRIPGSRGDVTANAWRVALCAISLAYLLFYLVRFAFRCTQRHRKKYQDMWWDRWLLLNIVSLCIIQAAVWESLQNASNLAVGFVGENLPVLANTTTTSYVALFDNVSRDEKLAEVLLGICLVLENLKLFQLVQNVWPSFASPYLTLNYICLDLFAWLLLILCFYFFFALGAVLIYGSWLGPFSSTGLGMQNAFLIMSRLPNAQASSPPSSASLLSTEFWRTFEGTDLPLMWEIESFFQTYQVNGVVSFAFWFSLVVLVIFWTLRNLLLGIVMTGYESVRREIDTNNLELKLELRTYTSDGLPALRRLERFLWKIWHQVKLDHFLAVMNTRTGFAVTTSLQMRAIFEEALLPQWFRDEFLERFLFPLRLVDSAIILLVYEERAFSLSLRQITAIRSSSPATKEEAVGKTFDACREEFEYRRTLPFLVEYGQHAWQDAPQQVKDFCLALVERCPETSGQGFYFDIARFAFLLVARVSSTVTNGEALLAACSEQLDLDFSSVTWDELLAFVDHELQVAKQSVEETCWRLVEVFPVRGFSTSRPPTMHDLIGGDDENEVEGVGEEYEFNPQAQQKWDTCMMSGEFALTLSLISALRAQLVSTYLHQELFRLEQQQIDLKKEILRTQRLVDANNNNAVGVGGDESVSHKHGIEFHPHDNTYHVHFYSGKVYKWVGVFANQDEAEAALARTIQEYEEEQAGEDDENEGGENEDGENESAHNWKTDNLDYSSQANLLLPPNTLRENDFLSHVNVGGKEGGEGEFDQDDDEGHVPKLTWRQVMGVEGCKLLYRFVKSVCSGLGTLVLALLGQNRGAHTLTYDITDTLWRDSQGRVVMDIITKPKTILPVAGNTYRELNHDKN
ncbi:hypothetical protein BASA81_015195 [Batrachochytrium salamandrivorans]|nr:hypothetical protein BASA81_015195 [Batrachochytrium salamandrivorans]